ncbi:MAG: preprotein translocase subunit SecE [Hirschia sp.]|nr:preprotein translocase subunit SecE [Hirschia sp.]MBF19844.1 preprotein translocase subunit SecE [Hirschia sp.]|tara:strand:- start:490 stop:696 length:207 start_codon:yes stop_codon:yes gene_type:complete
MAETKKRTGPVEFVNQVRAEGRKVTWTSRQETIAATIMVLIMVVLASVFFLVTDQVTSWVVKMITGIE